MLADAPMLIVSCTPWRFLSQVPDYPQYNEQKRDSHYIVSLVFAITQPSPLYVEWDFLFRILLVFLTEHMGQTYERNRIRMEKAAVINNMKTPM